MSKIPAPSEEICAESLQLAELFERLEDVQFWIKDRAGRYCRVNRAFLLNYALTDPAQILGRTDYDLSPAFLADQFRFDDEQVLAGQRIVNRIERVGQAGRISSWSVTNKIPIRSARGCIVGTAGTTRLLGEEGRELIGAQGFEAVVAHIRDQYREHISNTQLAVLAHMSIRAFERRFQDTFHVTPQQYIRKLRVRMASRALVYGDKPLAEVALDCGFADQSHFTRQFRQLTNQTPREYREHYRRVPAGPPAAESAAGNG